MTTRYTVPRGTYDILPSDSFKWEFLESTFRQVAKLYGYREISTPMFEQVEVFERSAGDKTDIVQKEMYRFTDRKGRSFALRPEGTAPVIRSFVENNLGANVNVTKLFYIGSMFRYDRPQSGRSRQFSQYGCECIGSNHPYYDAENIAVFWTYLKTLGLKNFVVEINSIGCPDCSEAYHIALKQYFYKSLDVLCPDCKDRYEKKPKRLLDCKVSKCKEISLYAPSMLDFLDQKCNTHFLEVQKYLDMFQIAYIVNPRIVRGLDYYSQTAFEFINNNLGAQNALGGGGRYDGLVQQMGGKDTPAVGFAGGFSRLLLSMEQENLYQGENQRPKYYIATLSEKATPVAIKLIHFLRTKGHYTEFEIEKTSMKAQMKSADKLKAEFVIFLGEEEIEKKYLTIKNMDTTAQWKVEEKEFIASMT